MTKARDLADLGNKTSLDEINDAYDAGTLSNRNMIINGGLLCWQRGISHGSGGGIVYTADRFWKYSPSVSGTYERSTDAPDGFAYSMHYNVDGSTAGSGTTVEFSRQGYFPQGQYTFSFYVKGDLTNTNLGIGFRNSVGSGTDQVNFSPITNYGNYTDWTRVVRTFTINLDPHANNKFLNLEFAGMPAGVKFTGVQLELGDTATPFEHRSFGDELAKCQRYFRVIGPYGNPRAAGGNDFFLVNVMHNNEPRLCAPYFDTAFRATPSVTLINHSNGGTGALTEFSSGTVRSQTSFSQIGLRGGGYPQFNGNFGNPAIWRAEYNAEL
jgi:hypothetical protein